MVLKIKPLLAVVGLGVCMCVAVIITLGNQTPALVLESADSEHAIENSFFDSLAAKDLAKDRRARKSKDLNSKQTALSDKQERQVENNYFKGVGKDKGKTQSKLAGVHASHKMPAKSWKPTPYNKMVHFKGKAAKDLKAGIGKKASKHESMRAEFAKEQQQLHAEQNKMRHFQEKDREKAEEQKMDLERLKAHQQANAYEEHLKQINDAVFPPDIAASGGSAHAVSHALTDDMHAPKITKADYERHPITMHNKAAMHGSNRLFRRIKNSGKDFAKQVWSNTAVSHEHHKTPKGTQLHTKPAPQTKPVTQTK